MPLETVALCRGLRLTINRRCKMKQAKKETRDIVNFCELSEEWQTEAINNLDDEANEALYLEPLEDQNPLEHVLYDLVGCMPVDDQEYNAVIDISNNSAMALDISDCFETAEVWFI